MRAFCWQSMHKSRSPNVSAWALQYSTIACEIRAPRSFGRRLAERPQRPTVRLALDEVFATPRPNPSSRANRSKAAGVAPPADGQVYDLALAHDPRKARQPFRLPVFVHHCVFEKRLVDLPKLLAITIKPELRSLILVSKEARISRPKAESSPGRANSPLRISSAPSGSLDLLERRRRIEFDAHR